MNARSIPTAAYQVLHLLSCTGGWGVPLPGGTPSLAGGVPPIGPGWGTPPPSGPGWVTPHQTWLGYPPPRQTWLEYPPPIRPGWGTPLSGPGWRTPLARWGTPPAGSGWVTRPPPGQVGCPPPHGQTDGWTDMSKHNLPSYYVPGWGTPIRPGQGTPQLDLARVTPPIWTWLGYPHQTWLWYAPSDLAGVPPPI